MRAWLSNAWSVVKNLAKYYWHWLKLASPRRFESLCLQQQALGRDGLRREIVAMNDMTNRQTRRRAAYAKRRKRRKAR